MDIEFADEEKEEEKVDDSILKDFHLSDFGKSSREGKSCIVEKEFYENWLPEVQPTQEFNWIVQEILGDINEIPTSNVEFIDENNEMKNSVMIREYSMTALPQETGEQIVLTNVLYPIVDDPFIMGQIACASLLNKLFLMNLSSCSRIVFLLAVCEKWSNSEKEAIDKITFDGFKKTAMEANIIVNESKVHSDTICMIGGMLSTISPSKLNGFPNDSIIGDVIVLTKPLGIQTTLDSYKIYYREQSETKDRLTRAISDEDMKKSYESAIYILTMLNLQAVKMTENYSVHAATEINGHSLMEHVQMLAEKQLNEVAFYIYNLPIIAKMVHISKILGNQTDLIQGNIPEISGGLLLVMPREQAAGYCRNLLNEGNRAWIIGVVEKGQRKANMIKKARIIDWVWKSEPSA